MEIFNLIFKPFIWAFDQFANEKIAFNGVPFIYILVALIILGILIINLVPLADGIGRGTVYDFSEYHYTYDYQDRIDLLGSGSNNSLIPYDRHRR